MKVETIRLKGVHFATFRMGEISTVIGACWVTPDPSPRGDVREPRLCLATQFEDGYVDYVPVSEVLKDDPAWKLVTSQGS